MQATLNMQTTTIQLPKPIIKWVGGKTKIIGEIFKKMPKKIHNYHEIFLGGGSVLFAILHLRNLEQIQITGKIAAYDINEPLIYVYKNIQSWPNELYDKIVELIQEFNKASNQAIAKDMNKKTLTKEDALISKEVYYYWIRLQYNNMTAIEKRSIAGSAMFIFLNKTCFRGVFRLNQKGEYNVPYGNNKNPEIINRAHLNEISALIQDVVFECANFKESLSGQFTEDDFIYMDPPYAPESNTSFVSYSADGFGLLENTELFTLCSQLVQTCEPEPATPLTFINDYISMGQTRPTSQCNNQTCKWLMNNADVKLVRDNFPPNRYTITEIRCRRAINCINPNAQADELIITNYL